MQRQKLLASDGGVGNNFGYSVAIDGDTLVVGKAGTVENQAAYVFVFDGTPWIEQAKLTTTDPLPLKGFSQSVAIVATPSDTPYFGEAGDERLAYVLVTGGRQRTGTMNCDGTARLTAPDIASL